MYMFKFHRLNLYLLHVSTRPRALRLMLYIRKGRMSTKESFRNVVVALVLVYISVFPTYHRDLVYYARKDSTVGILSRPSTGV